MKNRGRRRTYVGTVVSARVPMNITVKVQQLRKHPKYGKYVRADRRVHAHDENSRAREGDVVRIIECRPISKTKRWRLVEVVECSEIERDGAAQSEAGNMENDK